MNDIKSERRWQIRKLIIAVNLILLGVAYYMDVMGIKGNMFMSTVDGFQLASAGWFAADYWTIPKE